MNGIEVLKGRELFLHCLLGNTICYGKFDIFHLESQLQQSFATQASGHFYQGYIFVLTAKLKCENNYRR